MPKKKTGGILTVMGLDTSKPGEYIDNRSTPDCQNVDINRMQIRKRSGTSTVGSTQAEEILNGIEFERAAVKYNVRIGLDEIHLYNSTDSEWNNVTTPLVVVAGNKYLDFNIGGAEKVATIATGTYPLGDANTETGSLCKAIHTAIVAAEATGTYTVTVNSAGKVVITRSAGTFQLLWKTGTHGSDNTDDHIGTLIGYDDSADDTAALTYTADTAKTSDLAGTTSDPVDITTPLLSGSRIIVFTNKAVDNIRKFTGAGGTADLGGSPPKARYVESYKTYLVLANLSPTGYYMRVQWSDTGDIETWSGGNSGSQDLVEEGDQITGLAIMGDYLTVHKDSCIYLGYLVNTSSIFQFERKAIGHGAICNATIKELPSGEQVYLARDGIRIFNGISAPLIGSPITDEIRENINLEYIHKAWSIIIDDLDEYWVAIPMGSETTADTIYKYNYRTGQVHKDKRSNMTAAWKYTAGAALTLDDLSGDWESQTWRWDDQSLQASASLVTLADNTGITYKRDALLSNDNGSAIESYWISKDFQSEEYGRLVRWQQMEIWAKGNNISLEYSINEGNTWTPVSTYSLSSDYPTDDAPVMAYFDVVSSKIRFKFYNNTAAETYYLKQFITSYRDREVRQ